MRRIPALALMLLTAPAMAASTDAVTDMVSRLSGGKASIIKTFPATAIGMTGVVMKRGANHVIVFVEPNGKYMLSGVAIDANGKNLSQQYSEQYIPKPDFSAMWTAAEKTAFVEYGSPTAKKTLYVVGESNCGYCKRFHKDIKPYVDRGEINVRWILMGFDDAADAKAAGVIAAANPKDALEQLYEKGTAAKATSIALEKVKVNHAFAEAHGVGGTPFILSRGADGKVSTMPGAVTGKELEKLVAAAGR